VVVSTLSDVAAHALNDQPAVGQEVLFARQRFAQNEERQWWVFYTKSRQEKALTRYLTTKQIPHYLPLYEKSSLIRGRRFTSLLPLFSNYVFLLADPDERIAALESNRVARTIEVPDWRQMEFGSDLVQIQRLIESGVPLSIEARIQPGQRVRVRSGRLAGLEGMVTKRRGGSRLLIAVNYLQQGASIEIDDFSLEVI
jgi:transcriptional antiterminator RfaH